VYGIDYQRPGALFQRCSMTMQTQKIAGTKKPEGLMGSCSGFFVVLPRGLWWGQI